MMYYVAPGIIFAVLEPPYIIYRNPICKELFNNKATREHPRAGSKQMAANQAVAQTQSRCLIAARERPRAGSKQMATYQAVAQTQSRCLIAAREHPRAGSKQMATYQAVVKLKRRVAAAHQICAAQLLHKLGLLTSLARSYTLYPLCIINECCVAHTYTA